MKTFYCQALRNRVVDVAGETVGFDDKGFSEDLSSRPHLIGKMRKIRPDLAEMTPGELEVAKKKNKRSRWGTLPEAKKEIRPAEEKKVEVKKEEPLPKKKEEAKEEKKLLTEKKKGNDPSFPPPPPPPPLPEEKKETVADKVKRKKSGGLKKAKK